MLCGDIKTRTQNNCKLMSAPEETMADLSEHVYHLLLCSSLDLLGQ